MNHIEWLKKRGISEETANRFGITGDGTKIEIPIRNKEGVTLFSKFRAIPNKAYFHQQGAKSTIFGLDQLKEKWCVLVEGELDAVCLSSHGVPAVSGTAGAGCFKDEWVALLPSVVFVCYDTDPIGKESARKVHWKIHGSRIVELPEQYKDVTDYLREHTADEFLELVKKAVVVEKPVEIVKPYKTRSYAMRDDSEIERARSYPIPNMLKFTRNKTRCLWHAEKTASLTYYPQTNTVFCFGCRKRGSAIDVYMQKEGKGFKEALSELQKLSMSIPSRHFPLS